MKAAPGRKRSKSAKAAAIAERLVDLGACIAHLEKTRNLVRVRSEVDARHELAGIAKRFEGGKCVLFERVKDSGHPVLVGLLWNRDIAACVFGVRRQQVPFVIADAIGAWQKDKAALPARTVRFQFGKEEQALKVPHMGWNTVRRAESLGRVVRMNRCRIGHQMKRGISITRESDRNSFRYARTAPTVGASGVPRLINSTPMRGRVPCV